jgi:hypothetical protein
MAVGSRRERAGAGGSGFPGSTESAEAGARLSPASHLVPSAPVRPRLLPPIVVLLAACANIQAPPGGPPDKTPPALASVFPESLAVLPSFKDEVEFRFNEVVSEGGSPSQGRGTGDLEKLVILSPTNRFPNVGWHRRRITVRPAEGWKPNRVYRVELLPGITDVRQNQSKVESVVTFTTGAELPRDSLTGRVFDWKAGAPAQGALIEAVLEPDSLPYRALTDSAGKFSFGPLPRGEYLVFGVLDQNKDFRRDPREAFDTVRVRPESVKIAVPELYAFVHDTLPPRIQQITPIDSVSATITFAQSLDPAQKLDSSAAAVRKLPDSSAVPVVALILHDTSGAMRPREPGALPPLDSAALRRRLDTTGVRRPRPDSAAVRRPPADTAGARRVPQDTTGAGPADSVAARLGLEGPSRPAMNRPPLTDRMTIKVGVPWHPGDRFDVSVTGVRTVSGRSGNVHGLLVIPVQKKPSGAPGAAADSTGADSAKARRARPDSIAKPDSLERRRP